VYPADVKSAEVNPAVPKSERLYPDELDEPAGPTKSAIENFHNPERDNRLVVRILI
jgi:hypothetical protein